MPFTVNVGPYVGGQLYASGLSSFGSSISEGIQKAVAESRKQEEEQGADQIILNFAKQQGMVTPEMEADYLKGSSSKKNGIIVGLTRQFAMSQEQQRLKLAQDAAKRVPFTINGKTFNITESDAAHIAAQEAIRPTKVPFEIGGYKFNIPETQAAQIAATQEGKSPQYEVQTEIGKVKVPGSVVVSKEAEEKRLAAAQRPKPITPAEQRAQREEKRKVEEKLPERQFTKKYSVPPRDVAGQLGKDVYELRDATGKVIGTKGPGGETGITDPSKAPTGSYWHAPGQAFREKPIDVSQKTPTGTVRVKAWKADPNGTHFNIKGQHIPLEEAEGIKNRAAEVYKTAAKGIAAGKDPAKVAAWVQWLGYDPAMVPKK